MDFKNSLNPISISNEKIDERKKLLSSKIVCLTPYLHFFAKTSLKTYSNKFTKVSLIITEK
jgi:hypothetical protein